MSSDRLHRPIADLEEYETLVLESLGLGSTSAPIARWAKVYEQISSRLTTEPINGPSALARSDFDPAEVSAVWGLVYGARTYEVASRIFSGQPPPQGTYVELGAGWGSGALAASKRFGVGAVRLVDLSEERLKRARALFEVAEQPVPATLRVDARGSAVGVEEGGSVCLPYSFGEIFPDPNPAAASRWVLSTLQRLGPKGRLYILEPGSRPSARRLQALRDAVAGRVEIFGPCTRVAGCPLLADSSEWCHFTWPFRPGPVTRSLMEASSRRWQELHTSWLVLGLEPEAERPQSATRIRILETRHEGRTKSRFRGCGPGGMSKMTALARTEAFRARIEAIQSGALLELDLDSLTEKGDGLRLEATSAFRVLM